MSSPGQRYLRNIAVPVERLGGEALENPHHEYRPGFIHRLPFYAFDLVRRFGSLPTGTSQANGGISMQCRHEVCVCEVSGGDEYCSDHCRNSGSADACDCGHADCELHQEKRRMSPGIN